MKIYKHKDGRCNASVPQIKALREAAGLFQEDVYKRQVQLRKMRHPSTDRNRRLCREAKH